jgi:hypothetical protein
MYDGLCYQMQTYLTAVFTSCHIPDVQQQHSALETVSRWQFLFSSWSWHDTSPTSGLQSTYISCYIHVTGTKRISIFIIIIILLDRSLQTFRRLQGTSTIYHFRMAGIFEGAASSTLTFRASAFGDPRSCCRSSIFASGGQSYILPKKWARPSARALM